MVIVAVKKVAVSVIFLFSRLEKYFSNRLEVSRALACNMFDALIDFARLAHVRVSWYLTRI